MKQTQNNFAYIDAANLYQGISHLGWQLDYAKFMIWLKEKYGVARAYLFIGLAPKYNDLYTNLQEAGFTLVFKETTCDSEGRIKGNCDADLVLKTVVDYYEKKFDKAILISSDGDYSSLAKFLKEKCVLRTLVSPSNKCSFLLRKINIPILYLDTQRGILKISQKEKAPGRD